MPDAPAADSFSEPISSAEARSAEPARRNPLVGRTVLVLAPHTDDAELGCGGTICRLIQEGFEVHVAAFSTADDSLPDSCPPGTLKREFYDAMTIIGIPKNQLIVHGYPVRKLANYRQEVLEHLVGLNRRLVPVWVLTPSTTDMHQDHQILSAESLRAFKKTTLWGYELPWNHITFSAQAFVRLTPAHVALKRQALLAYKSQVEAKRPYFAPDFIEGLARVRGVQVGAEYAEAFELIRVIY